MMAGSNTKPASPSKDLTLFTSKNHLNLDLEDDKSAAIHLAVWEGNLAIVKELLVLYRSSCVNAKDKRGRARGRTPLHNAAQLGHNSIVTALLDNGADINARTVFKYTALALAAKNNSVETVKTLLRRNADINTAVDSKNREDGDGMTPVHIAARLKSPTILLQLLWRGAKTDAITVNGDTALHFAATAASASCYFFLSIHGTPGKANKDGLTPTDIISKLKKPQRAPFDKNAQWLTLGDKDQFLACIRKNTDDPDLPRAVHTAVEKEIIGALVYLLQLDSDLANVKHPRESHTPLHAAAKLGRGKAAKVLIEHGAKVDAKASRDWTPLMLACNNKHADIASMLCKAGADTTLKNANGDTAALLAIRNGLSVPELPPLFRYVSSRDVSGLAGNGSNQDSKKLSTPDPKNRSREPSPSWPAESDDRVQGELFAVSDAQQGNSSDVNGKR